MANRERLCKSCSVPQNSDRISNSQSAPVGCARQGPAQVSARYDHRRIWVHGSVDGHQPGPHHEGKLQSGHFGPHRRRTQFSCLQIRLVGLRHTDW